MPRRAAAHQQPFYGQEIRLVVCGYVRPEADFTSLEALAARIRLDGEVSEAALASPALAAYADDPFLLPSPARLAAAPPPAPLSESAALAADPDLRPDPADAEAEVAAAGGM